MISAGATLMVYSMYSVCLCAGSCVVGVGQSENDPYLGTLPGKLSVKIQLVLQAAAAPPKSPKLGFLLQDLSKKTSGAAASGGYEDKDWEGLLGPE